MNNRLTIQDLAGLLAEYTGKDRNSTERFLKEFIGVVSEGVYTDKQVKVKGLGTFKIIPVEKRESIHVNTGERFVIPEHYKFSFLPDKELRELVNRPFSFFETIELNENVDFSDVDVVPDEPEAKETEDESVEEIIPEVESSVTEDIPSSQEAAALPEVKPVQAEPDEPQQVDGQQLVERPETLETLETQEPVKVRKEISVKRKAGLFAFLVLLLLVFVIGGYLNRNSFFSKKEVVEVVTKDTVVVPVETIQETASVLETDTVQSKGKEPVIDKPEVAPPTVIARVKIEPGSRLTLISLKYYGSKLFWVYLYEYNKAIIKDPNNVPIGTVIEVPAPALYGIDCHDRSSLEKAATRQTEILSGKP